MLEKEQKRKQRVWLAQFGASTPKHKVGYEKTMRATPTSSWSHENMGITCHKTESHPVPISPHYYRVTASKKW